MAVDDSSSSLDDNRICGLYPPSWRYVDYHCGGGSNHAGLVASLTGVVATVFGNQLLKDECRRELGDVEHGDGCGARCHHGRAVLIPSYEHGRVALGDRAQDIEALSLLQRLRERERHNGGSNIGSRLSFPVVLGAESAALKLLQQHR